MKSISIFVIAAAPLVTAAWAQPSRYTLTDLGIVGASPSQPFVLANNGLIAGAAAASGGRTHATLWYQGMAADIGTPGFGALNSVAFSVNQRGQAVGEAESATADNPTNEDFCGFKAMGLPANGAACVPFLWEYGIMIPLPLLGGSNGVANFINNHGVVAGLAETAVADPGCPNPQVLQFRPVIWDREGVHELPIASGDADGVAYSVNDSGQVVGGSGACSTFNFGTLANLRPAHALLWDTGTMTDLGNLGGTGHFMGNLALNINNKGQVVGQSDLPGDQAFHGFLWSAESGMKDIGTLPGDNLSVASNLNNEGVVVGGSLDADFNPRAFVWQNGVMSDLNSLIPAGSLLDLLVACGINQRGEITGLAADKSGNAHGYLLTPSDGAATSAGLPSSVFAAADVQALNDDVRKLLHRLGVGRFGLLHPPRQ